MSRRKQDPLRPLTDDERSSLTRLSRSRSAPAAEVARARILLAVDRGDDYQQAARVAGRRSGDAASHLVARFNAEGLAALSPRHGGGRPRVYDPAARQRVLREVGREPTPEADGTTTWSLSAPRKSLRSAPDGLPVVASSTDAEQHGAGRTSVDDPTRDFQDQAAAAEIPGSQLNIKERIQKVKASPARVIFRSGG